MDELNRLLELPAAVRLSVAGDELALVTLTHEHADEVTIRRRRLGSSIDLGALLQLVGLHGLADAPQVQISAVAVPELPAPIEEPPAAAPIETVSCVQCDRTFKNQHGLLTHIATKHKAAQPSAAVPAELIQGERVPCPQCERSFKNSHALEVHLGRGHKAAPEPEPAAPERWVCPQCGSEYRSQLGYAAHVRVAHAQTPVSEPVAQSDACGACGEPLLRHLCCSDCAGLLGPGHNAGESAGELDGRPLCSVCVGYRATLHELELTP